MSVAQQRLLQGVVKDSLKEIEFANIMATPTNSNYDFVFGVTDKNGNFEILLKNKISYSITVSFMGYKPYIFVIDSLTKHLIKRIIILKPNKQELDEVVIKYQTPVKITQDSIIYNIKHFTNGKERKLKAILQKLPGVEVNRYGQITIMGKKVNSIMVEGKLFFGGDSELAVNNIPANAVKKVEVIKDYNNISFMKGLNDKQKMVINIKLKEGKKRFIFGDIVSGTNIDKNYSAKSNLFYYSKKTNLGYIGNLNDIGEPSMVLKDILRFENNELLSETNRSFGIKNSSLYHFMGNDNFTQKKTIFNALQWQQDLGQKWAFYIYGIITKDNTEYKSEQLNQYLLEPKIEENILYQKQLDKSNSLGKISLSYIPNAIQHFDYQVTVNKSLQKYWNKTQAITNDNSKYINNIKNNDGLAVNQAFFYHRKFSKRHIFRFYSKYHFSEQQITNLWHTNQPIMPSVLAWQTADNYEIAQPIHKTENNLDILLKYYYKINHRNHLYFSLANNLFTADYNNKLWQQETTNRIYFNNFNNNYQLKINDLYTGIQYRIKIANGHITPAIYAHHLSQSNTQTKQTKNNWLWLPEIKIKTIILRGKFTADYKITLNIPSAEQFANNYIFNNFNTVQKGNSDLTNELYHSIHLHHTFYKLKHNTSLYTNISYTHKSATVANEYIIKNTEKYLSYKMLHQPQQSFDISTSFSRKWKKLYYSISPSASFSTDFELVNNRLTTINSRLLSTRFSISTRSLKLPDIKIGVNCYSYQSEQKNALVKYSYFHPFAYMIFNYKAWELETNYEYEYVAGLGTNHYHKLDFSLAYQPEDKAFGFSISINNAINQQAQQTINASSYMFYRQTIHKQPLVWMIKLHYKL